MSEDDAVLAGVLRKLAALPTNLAYFGLLSGGLSVDVDVTRLPVTEEERAALARLGAEVVR